MKLRLLVTTAVAMLAVAAFGLGLVGPDPAEAAPKNQDCATIQSGDITASTGETLAPGYDEFGYNYQAYNYVGSYDGVDRRLNDSYWGDTGEIIDDQLVMKWNDAWLSNRDCDGDGKLDRHYGFDTYIGSGAWLMNVQRDNDGNTEDCDSASVCYVKIIAKPTVGYDCALIGGTSIWGSFCIIQEVAAGAP